jgi:hypothetical protein
VRRWWKGQEEDWADRVCVGTMGPKKVVVRVYELGVAVSVYEHHHRESANEAKSPSYRDGEDELEGGAGVGVEQRGSVVIPAQLLWISASASALETSSTLRIIMVKKRQTKHRHPYLQRRTHTTQSWTCSSTQRSSEIFLVRQRLTLGLGGEGGFSLSLHGAARFAHRLLSAF